MLGENELLVIGLLIHTSTNRRLADGANAQHQQSSTVQKRAQKLYGGYVTKSDTTEHIRLKKGSEKYHRQQATPRNT